jgi:tetratricopeptide (TPR) repeat protein
MRDSSSRERRALRGGLFVWVVGATLSGCVVRGETVTRVADGVPHEGRYIAEDAYALYARGALLEAHGDRNGALAQYLAALDADPDAPEILAHVARLNCELAGSPTDDWARRARAAVTRALAIDAESSVVLAESARCHARFREIRRALADALRAARADPESMRIQLLVVELAEAAGQLALARAWLDALVARSPDSRLAWRYVAEFAERTRDPGRALRAARASADDRASARQRSLSAALARGDLDAARSAATALGISPGELAARATLEGKPSLAREQAELVLAADPTDPNAWIALLALSDLERNTEEWVRTLKAAPDSAATAPGPSARRLQAELLERVVGPEARRAWDAAF